MRMSKKPEERRREIIEAALELFLEKGYENVSVKDITNKLGVAAGLFHYYFRTKEEVFMECVKYDRQKFLYKIKEKDYFPPGAGAVEKMNRLLRDAMQSLEPKNRLIRDAFTLNSAMLLHHVRDYVISEMADTAAELIEEGNAEGVFRCKYPQATAEIALFGISHYFLRERERDPGLKNCMIGEFVYKRREDLRNIVMDLLNMEEPHGLLSFCAEEEKNPADSK